MQKFSTWLSEATKEDFFNLADLQRDVPEHAMMALQRILGGGIMNVTAEHVGDIIHRMTERPTFSYAGYDYVKNKVHKTLEWLTNPYGFRREFEQNITSAAKYFKVDENEFRQKVYDALEKYAQAHEKLPTYNRAQKLAQIAAVSLGRRQFNKTVNALKMLETHLGSEVEWVRFAHQGLTQ
jgi:hypothetical protein